MCIHLFNPPAPNCDSSRGCGNCVCVPPFWKVSAQAPAIAAGDRYVQLYMGDHIIPRDQASAREPLSDFPCRWELPFLIPDFNQAGGIAVGYGNVSVELGGGGIFTWYVIFAGAASPGDPPDAIVYSQFGFDRITPPNGPQPWKCLGKNRLYRDDFDSTELSGLGPPFLPDFVDVEPFWP